MSVFRPLDINQNPIVCCFINIYTYGETVIFHFFMNKYIIKKKRDVSELIKNKKFR